MKFEKALESVINSNLYLEEVTAYKIQKLIRM